MAGAVSYGAGAVTVEGLVEFQTALRELEATVNVQIREELLEVAEPVAVEAHDLAIADISGMKRGTGEWADMRVGQSTGLVYVAPRLHGARGGPGRRPNLATLLIVKAMEPAAEHEHARVEAGVARVLDRAFEKAGV